MSSNFSLDPWNTKITISTPKKTTILRSTHPHPQVTNPIGIMGSVSRSINECPFKLGVHLFWFFRFVDWIHWIRTKGRKHGQCWSSTLESCQNSLWGKFGGFYRQILFATSRTVACTRRDCITQVYITGCAVSGCIWYLTHVIKKLCLFHYGKSNILAIFTMKIDLNTFIKTLVM